MPSKYDDKITLHKAFALILLSLVIISGGAAAGMFYYFRYRESLANDSRYNIVAIVQNCCEGEWLKTSLLAELLQLSIDRPTNLYRFETLEVSNKLLMFHIFRSVEIKKIKPGTVHVEYTLRQPVAYLGDYTNTAMDDRGVLIPFKPFYTPKNIPILFVGFDMDSKENTLWGSALEGEKLQLALTLLNLLKTHYSHDGCQVRSIDISKAFDSNCGQREIVITLVEQIEQDGKRTLTFYPRILRITVEHYFQQLADYLVLREHLNTEQSKIGINPSPSKLIIDMRIPQLAFLNSNS